MNMNAFTLHRTRADGKYEMNCNVMYITVHLITSFVENIFNICEHFDIGPVEKDVHLVDIEHPAK